MGFFKFWVSAQDESKTQPFTVNVWTLSAAIAAREKQHVAIAKAENVSSNNSLPQQWDCRECTPPR